MRRFDDRFIGWLIAFIMAVALFAYMAVSCVNVRVQVGDENQSDREHENTGIDAKSTNQKDSLSYE